MEIEAIILFIIMVIGGIKTENRIRKMQEEIDNLKSEIFYMKDSLNTDNEY